MTQELPEGTVTVLFTDAVGSTELTNRLGDEPARRVLGACEELVRQQVARHRGREVKGMGDGLMVAFQSARRAIACATDIQRAVADRNRREPKDGVAVRVALHTGEVIAERADLFGATVNAAARIAGEAEGGEILVSDAVKGVLGAAPQIELEDRGAAKLKGFSEPWRLYAVRWQEEPGLRFLERTPFIGREAERAELRRLLDQAVAGHGALALIGGEPGVGKTRLAEELMAEARARPMTALIGRCYETEGAPPYIPFVEMTEAAARIFSPEALRDALGESAPEVAQLLPDLRRVFPDIPQPPELPPEQARRYLYNGMRDFIARSARAQPALLVLDDLQWADEPTLLLLQHIAQELAQMPVLMVGTYRDVELEVGRPFANALEELLRHRLAQRIALRRFPEEAVATMLRALSGHEPPPALVQAIYAETEGNAFFVEEVFRHLTEEGKLFDDEGRWRSVLSVSEVDVPESVRLVIGRRLQRVGEETRRVLAAAAVIGRGFSFELLEALADDDPEALLDAVDEAERARLIVAVADGPEARYTFAHELIRQTLVSGLSLPRRQRLHLRVAEAIEAAYPSALEEHAADLAHHLHQAGAAADRLKTVRYLTLAGDRKMDAAAFEEALRDFESALSLQPPDDRRAHAGLMYKRGLAYRSLGRWEEGVADWRQALDVYEELGDIETVGHISSEVMGQLFLLGRLMEALDTARRGLIAVGERVSADRCRLLGLSGLALSIGGQHTAAAGMLDQALAMAHELGDDRVLGEALESKTMHHAMFAQYERAVEVGLRSAEILEPAGELWFLSNALSFTAWAHQSIGRFDEAADIREKLEPLALRLGNHYAVAEVRRWGGWLAFRQTADLERFEEFARGSLDFERSLGFPWFSHWHTALGQAHFWMGRWEEALGEFQEGARLEPPGFVAGYSWSLYFLGMAYAGDRAGALELLGQRRGELPRASQANTVGSWTALIAAVEGLAVLAELDRAAGLYPLVLDAIDTGTPLSFELTRLLQAVAGIAAACGRRWEEAEEHYQTALRQAHELPVVIAQPEVRRWYARMLLDRAGHGDRDKAFRLLTEAIGMYRQIGMPKHVEMAEAMLAEC